MADTLMSEGLIGRFDWHHLQKTCRRLNGRSCASCGGGRKTFSHSHNNYTQWLRTDLITIVILKSYLFAQTCRILSFGRVNDQILVIFLESSWPDSAYVTT